MKVVLILLFAALVAPLISPVPLSTLAPLALFFSSKNPRKFSWVAFGIGLGLDLTQSEYPLGLYAITYPLVLALLAPLRARLALPMPIALPPLSALFGGLSTLLLGIVVLKGRLSFPMIFMEACYAGLVDGLYALLGVSLPLALLSRKASHHFRWDAPPN